MRTFRLLLGLLLAFAMPALAHAGSRVALVVGNGTYAAAGQLANPVNDARLVGQSLRQAGFETIPLSNVANAPFRAALNQFRARATGAEMAMVYFAGHGIEAKGKNWLIPVDARLENEFQLPDEAIDLDRVLEALEGAKVRIVVLDACRNNPFGQNWKSGTRAVTRGLGRIEADDVMVIYAAAPGSTASDGTGSNSPFARALSQRLTEPGLLVQMLGNAVRDDVLAATGGQQRPFVSASMGATPVYLVPGGASITPLRPAVPPGAPAMVTPTVRPPAAPVRSKVSLIVDCDRQAGDEFDPGRPAGALHVASADMQPDLAISVCAQAVEASPGDARMMAQLGRAYFANGDFASARQWLEQAATMGNGGAMVGLGAMYEQGNGVVQDYAQARGWYERSATIGHAEAMFSLGFLSLNGRGVARNFVEARTWFEQAAAKGHAVAMYNLALLYRGGDGVAKDMVQARRWYEQAAARGDKNSQQWLADHPQ